jgi:iron(III) transport system permease protein
VADRRDIRRVAVSGAGLAVAVFFALPFVYLVQRAGTDWSATWEAMTSDKTLAPLWRTVQLAVLVTIASTVLGVTLAWLTTRTDLPGRRLWRVVVALPLVIPSFVGAASFVLAFARGGLLDQFLPADRLPDVRGLPGAVLVLTLLSYPYVYLPVSARLVSLPPSLEETARLLGQRPAQVMRRVVLPQCRASIAAGSLFVALYTVSEFGAVQFVQYDTLTRRLYSTMLRAPEVATAMGLVLGVLALVITVGERLVARRAGPAGVISGRQALRVRLGRWRYPSLLFVASSVFLALVAPISVLAWWVVRGTANGATRSVDPDLLAPTWHTTQAGVVAALVAIAVVLPLAFATVRHRDRIAGVAGGLVVAGFALPGLVSAFALVTWARGTALYTTFALLIAAYVLHFGGQALRAAQAAVSAVPSRTGEAARLLGASPLRRLVKVELPLMVPGLAAGAGLVMLSVLKELPATLILAPFGFDTLATNISHTFTEALLVDAGLASLLLIGLSALLTWFLVIRRLEHLHH